MSRKTLIFSFLVLMILLHQDFWLKDNPALILGFLPATLAYQMLFTIAAALGWLMIVKFAWPQGLEDDPENPDAVLKPGEGGKS